MGDVRTILDRDDLGPLGRLAVEHPEGTFAATPASMVGVRAIVDHRAQLGGTGLDWGCGSGILALVAARIPGVDRVIGLDINPSNVAIARTNARANELDDVAEFHESDSYDARESAGREALASCRGSVDFIIANPPSSDRDDGFGFRRAVVLGAAPFLKPGGLILLSVSAQYGEGRVRELLDLGLPMELEGVAATTPFVPFDCERPELRECLISYAAEEARGGADYHFRHPDDPGAVLTAQTALDHFLATDESPLSRWQTLLLRRSR